MGCLSSKPVKEQEPAQEHTSSAAAHPHPSVAGSAHAPAAAVCADEEHQVVLSADSISRQLRELQEGLTQQQQQLQQQPQQQQIQQQPDKSGSLPAAPPPIAVCGTAAAAAAGGAVQSSLQSNYSYSVQSFDELGATDSAASSPRSRSSYAASNQHQPPSRGASGSGAADFRSGKLRRPPRAQSSGVGLRSTLLEDNQQLSFTDSITNTTNSSEASPRRGQWQPGSRSNSQPLQDGLSVDPSSLHGGDSYLRSRSSHFEDSSSHLPHISSDFMQAHHQQMQQQAAQQQQQHSGGLRHVGSFDYANSMDGDNAAAGAGGGGIGGGAASTFGDSSVGGFATGGQQRGPGSISGSAARRGSYDPLSGAAGQVSLLQLQRAIEKIMVSDGEMYAKLQAGLKGIHSLARETNRLTVARDVTGATCINQYVVVKTLGRGSYGKVKLCLNTFDGQLYAIKMMNRSCLLRTLQRPRTGLRKSARRSVSANNAADATQQQQQHVSAAVAAAAAAGLTSGGLCSDEANDVNREIAILKKLDHPNVVKLFEVIDPPGSQYMMLVMEFLEKGPVVQTHNQSGFDSLPEEVAADYFRQAVLGLEYLHFHKVVHGDIKPENLLVSSNGELKISDFGCSRMADGQSSQTKLTGTPAFTAPELVSGNAADPFAADVWALGACLFCFIYGRVPFQGGCVLDVFKAIASQPLELPCDVTISPHLRELFMRLFDKDPDTRITLQEIMSHPWVTDEGRAPLRSCADLGLGSIEVTAQEQLGAIDRASVVSMIRARLKEKVFRSNEYLFQAGQPMNCVYFVMSGAVEILRSATQEDAEREFSGNTSIEHSFTVDIDESLMLDCSMVGQDGMMPIGAVNGRLHIDRLKARDLKYRHRGHLMEHMEVVVDVKGPGQVVGEVFMQEAPPPCRYSARARGDVLALKLTQENYVRALASMMFEAEHGARATAHSAGASRGRPLPTSSISSPSVLGGAAAAAAAAAGGGSSSRGGGGGVPPGVGGGGVAGSSSSGLAAPGPYAFSSSSTGGGPQVAGSGGLSSPTAVAAAGAAAGRVTVAGPASMQSSTCGSLTSCKEGGQLQSSTPIDSSTAQLSLLAGTTNTSNSSDSLMARGVGGGGAGGAAGANNSFRGPLGGSGGHFDGGHFVGSTAGVGVGADDSGPLKLIGSCDGTDDEGQEQHDMHHPAAAAAAAVAGGVAGAVPTAGLGRG